jgi:glucosyl-3-phosphoglycerate synthase
MAERSVIIPARNEAGTIAQVVEQSDADQVVVVDGSTDGTGAIAARAGAEVHREQDLLPEFGPVLGKGDAMWRALSVVRGDVVVYVDADSSDFGAHFVDRLAAPIERHGAQFVKGYYRRPFRLGESVAPEGGGRVTELTAKPLLSAFYPELSVIHQPLAGEVAARRDLLMRLPFSTGYAVEVAMLIDAWKEVGIGAIAQADLEVRQNRHQSLSALRPMADSVLAAVAERLVREGRLRAGDRATRLVERPPLASLT